MLVTESRPRNLKWFHAGPLLYGDWGTSRLYVLGLAFFFTGAESVGYLVAIGLLMACVAWAYTIVCREFPDGGGVYTAARQLSPTLSVVGATLLLCGYLITAAISVVEAMHYIGVPDGPLLITLAITTIVFIGAVNWLGAKSAGTFALIIAFASLVVAGIMALLAIRFLPSGLTHMHVDWSRSVWSHWESFTHIVLALAGVEAVANMTGLMKKPVASTAKRTILPVLVEVVILNIVFGIAMTGIFADLPALQGLQEPLSHENLKALAASNPEAFEEVRAVRDTAMEVIAEHTATATFGAGFGAVFGKVSAVVFAGLLLSATNTAVMAMVSVLFAMGQDNELPKGLTKLNYSGVPWVGLVLAVTASIVVLLIERDPVALAELYIIGVCGAITVSVATCAFNKKLDVRPIERAGLHALGVFLSAVTITILVTRLNATIFAAGAIGIVLVMRFTRTQYRATLPEEIPVPAQGWLAEVKAKPIEIDPAKPRIMLAARGRYQAEFAADLARTRGATLFAIYVRTLRVMDLKPGYVPRVEEDKAAQEALGETAVLAKAYGVPFVPIYVTASDIAEEILDYTVTYNCDTLIMGKSRRPFFARKLEGDVVSEVAENLPDEVALITRSSDTPHVPRRKPDFGPTSEELYKDDERE